MIPTETKNIVYKDLLHNVIHKQVHNTHNNLKCNFHITIRYIVVIIF